MELVLRAWPVDFSKPTDIPAGDDLAAAIDRARELANQREYGSVVVTDDRAMNWAQFNMLWSWGRAQGQ